MNLIDRDKILDKIRDEVIPPLEFAELLIAYQIANVIINAPTVEVNDYKSIIEKLTKENIELKNNFEIACKSTDVLYNTFLKVEAERDAAVKDLKIQRDCYYCKYNDVEHLDNGWCRKCAVESRNRPCWEWRGVQNT